ncbi:malate synthase [Sporosarcina sp. Marseille-Q4063]|uniref:malate synthase n=1 Tax=Sporosarcina sp. Marseille-Q4063 TaxID=2810514 RepID=UPI001BB05E4F|nr:malate synthase [Sporosarcina sp. Marseille-Q4063]QUW22988.1 malate synthase [Sporosarcina sp. Marseille-Q4063]
MNLINEEITHKVFGEGNIVNHEDSIITIEFNEDIKKFVYPDAFGTFITLNDRTTAKTMKKVFLKKEMEEEALERKREEQALEQQRMEKLKNLRIHESSQVVFWLDEEEQQNVFVDWQVSTGQVQSGANKGQPNRAARLRPNSAGLLTARDSDQPETERQILGLYMINEAFSGELSDDGMVPSHEEFRIELTDQEAEKMLFWNYYINKNYPDRTAWNSGKYRYFDNIWTAQILKDIIALRTDEEQIKEAENFLEYFCQMNALDMNDIPEADGALKQ